MTILASTVIDAAKVRTKFGEQFASEALGKNLNASTPAGIQYGFVLEPSAGSIVQLTRHSVRGQSQAVVVDQAQELSFVVTETDAPTFNLAANAGTTVYLLLEIEFSSSGESTAANYRVVDAAELTSAVGLRSVVLGRIDVPAGGLIGANDIIQGDIQVSGLSRDGIRRWLSLFPNPDFSLGFAGFDTRTDTGGEVSLGLSGNGDSVALVLGDNVAPVANAESAIRFPVEGLRQADLFVLRSGITSQVALGANTGFFVRLIPVTDAGEQAAIVDRTFYTGLDLSPGYQDFGIYLEVPAIASDVNYVLVEVGELRGATENGQIILDNLEAYVRSIDNTRAYSESWASHRRVFVTGESEQFAPVFDIGGGIAALRGRAFDIRGQLGFPVFASELFEGFGFISGPNQPNGRITLASASYTASYRDSVVRDAIRGSMAFEILQTTSPYQLVDGAVTNTATAVEIAAGSIRFVAANGGSPFSNLDTYQLIDFPTQSSDFTGRPSGTYYVSWSAQDAAFTIDNQTFISSIALREKIPLVLVDWDGAAFTAVVDIAYRGKNIFSKTRSITVGPQPNPVDGAARTYGATADFASLRQAVEFATVIFSTNVGNSADSDARECEIILLEDFILDEHDIEIPPGVVLRGSSKNTEILLGGSASASAFMNIRGGCTIKDLILRPATGAETLTGLPVFNVEQTVNGNVSIEDVRVLAPTGGGNYVDIVAQIPDLDGNFTIENCRFEAIAPVGQILGQGNGILRIEDSYFLASPENNNADFMNISFFDEMVVENCVFDNRLNALTSTVGNRSTNGVVLTASGGLSVAVKSCRFYDMQLQVQASENLGLIDDCHFEMAPNSEVETTLRAQDFQGTIRDCSIRIVSATAKTYTGALLVATTVSVNDRDNIVITGCKIVATGDVLPAGAILCQVNGLHVKVSDCHFECGTAASDANPLNEVRALFASAGSFQATNNSFRSGSNEGNGIVTFAAASACQIIGNKFINFAPDRGVVLETDNNIVIGNIQENASAAGNGVTNNGSNNTLANNVAF